MDKQIKFTLESKEALHSLHIDIQKSVKFALKKLANGEIQGKPLTESLTGFSSLRVGNHRVIYSVEKDVIIVFDVGHRKNIYNKKL